MAGSILVDLVKIAITSTGTGAATLGAAVSGYAGRETLLNGGVYSYSIQQDSAYEFGRGTYFVSGATFVRSPIKSSSDGAPINLQPNATIAFTFLASDLIDAGGVNVDPTALQNEVVRASSAEAFLLKQISTVTVLGLIYYATYAAMNADTSQKLGQLAYVYADPTTANNGVYHYTTGGWVPDTAFYQGVSIAVQPIINAALARTQNAPFRASDNAGNSFYDVDAVGRVAGYRTSQGEQLEATNPFGMTTQALLRGITPSFLPTGFTPLSPAIPAPARYVWAGLSRDLRSDPTSLAITGYPFQWPPDPVPASQVRRARGTIGGSSFTLDSITVAEGPCTDFFRVRQYRDLSVMRDRKTGIYWHAVNCIQRAANGYVGNQFAISNSPDGLAWSLVGYVEIPVPTSQVWSPEWFVDDNGELYIIVAVNTNPQVFAAGDYLASQWGYHMLRCNDLTNAQFAYVGRISGTAFPTQTDGNTSMIDPFRFKRNGVHYVIWKAEPSLNNQATLNFKGTSIPYGTLGYAASTELLAGYDQGAPFMAAGAYIQGEGQYVIELPAGQQRRYMLGFDDYKTLYGGGSCYSLTDDFVTFTAPQQLPVSNVYNRHTTFVIGL